LKRQEKKEYTATIIPDSQGFHYISGFAVAVNSPSEYRELGNNDLIPEIITASGGRVYNISEIEKLIPDILEKKNNSIIHERVDLSSLFLFAALMLFSIDVIVRRLLEIFR
jgi:hypothetical protein